MINNERNLATKFIVPLMFQKYSRFLNYTNFGFVNLYTADINRPYLDKHVFLVYETTANVGQYNELNETLKAHPNFYSKYGIRLDKKFYEVYAFLYDIGEYKSAIVEILSGTGCLLPYQTKVKILKFWPYKIDSKEHEYLFNEISFYKEIKEDIIPEEDEPNDLLFQVQYQSTINSF